MALGRIGNDKLYGLIREGKLDARRLGGRTLITADSVYALAALLPPASL